MAKDIAININTIEESEMTRKRTSSAKTTKPAKPRASASEARIPELSPEHRKAYEEIRDLLDGQGHAKAEAWYAVGQKVAEIVADSEYGKKAVAKIAKHLGRDASLLYEAGRVAQAWPRQQFEELADRRDKIRKNRLSWSHFVELSRVADPDRQQLLIDKTLNEGLSVRDLKKQIAGPKPEADQGNDQPTNVARALRNFKAATETIIQNASHWEALVFDVLDAQDEQLATPRMLEMLEDVRATQLRAKKTCEDHLARLDACIARAEELLASPAAERSLGRPHNLVGSEVGDHE